MYTLKDKIYAPDCSHNDIDIDTYYKRHEVFGRFIEHGRGYVIERRDIPRDWAQYLCNDKVRCAVTNIGKGMLFHANGACVTKYKEVNGNYLPRNYNGERKFIIEFSNGSACDFFLESDNFTCTVRPGHVVYEGDVASLHVELCIFVPQKAPCECWNIKVTNNGDIAENIGVYAKQDIWRTGDLPELDDEKNEIRFARTSGWLQQSTLNIFKASHSTSLSFDNYDESYIDDSITAYYRETIKSEMSISPKSVADWNIISSACLDDNDAEEVSNFTDSAVCKAELESIISEWDVILNRMTCNVPDKNFECFMNIWLKNQIYMTGRYDRAHHLIGYRDGMQDSWGYMIMDPEYTKKRILFLLDNMHPDGRCPRGVHKYGDKHDLDDFCDAPIWIPITISAYIKETGDFGILNEKVGFFKSDETATVEEHIYRSLDYMYHSRGKNGLILMRDGDWADGLGGINKYGADATSAWVTIAAYNAHNIMSELYRRIGENEKADEMDRRSAEYKQIVNDVAWDGHWLIYGFFEDGEPIGSSKNLEGKIWLNPQAWGIFSGIIDEPAKIKKMTDAVSRYLDTPYGAMIMYPPYIFYGERNGRIQKQRPGMFLNSSIYNHAASFKVFSDVKRGDGDVAYDTFMRCLPNHPDNPDTRRTSEPYAVCNVYYGPDHPRYGMNLFTWFTATPAWLIHGGFEEILGVKADYDGIKIEPCVPSDWNEYSVSKLYRGTRYNIKFIRSEYKGVFVDGQKIDGNVVYSDNPACSVEVRY